MLELDIPTFNLQLPSNVDIPDSLGQTYQLRAHQLPSFHNRHASTPRLSHTNSAASTLAQFFPCLRPLLWAVTRTLETQSPTF
jgi:hypothetical protein